MIAILGAGFGLYGYLPALVEGCGERVILPEKSRGQFEARPELARFAAAVQWERDANAALMRADGVVLALPPSAQAQWIPQCLHNPRIKYLLLEKPLAPSPTEASAIWADVVHSSKAIRIGYTFRFTDWAKDLCAAISGSGTRTLSIEWNFHAHHFRHDLASWKRSHAAGGGAIRFYGIQLIALLAEIGYCEVVVSRGSGRSEDEIENWMAIFAGPALPECAVTVRTRSPKAEFRITGRTLEVTQSDPFENSWATDLDRRIAPLTALCQTLWQPENGESVWYERTIALWREVESANQFNLDSTIP